jgi:hypothetical protein
VSLATQTPAQHSPESETPLAANLTPEGRKQGSGPEESQASLRKEQAHQTGIPNAEIRGPKEARNPKLE